MQPWLSWPPSVRAGLELTDLPPDAGVTGAATAGGFKRSRVYWLLVCAPGACIVPQRRGAGSGPGAGTRGCWEPAPAQRCSPGAWTAPRKAAEGMLSPLRPSPPRGPASAADPRDSLRTFGGRFPAVPGEHSRSRALGLTSRAGSRPRVQDSHVSREQNHIKTRKGARAEAVIPEASLVHRASTGAPRLRSGPLP